MDERAAKLRSRVCVAVLAVVLFASLSGCEALVREREPGERPADGPAATPGQASREEVPYGRQYYLVSQRLTDTGTGTHYRLQPGWTIELRGRQGGGDVTVVVRVEARTRVINRTKTRLVTETRSVDGRQETRTERYVAMDRGSGAVLLFGEVRRNLSLEGAPIISQWAAGHEGAEVGMLLQGQPLPGARYYQEYAPETSLVQAETLSVQAVVDAPVGELRGCQMVRLSSPRSDFEEVLYYGRRIGVVKQGSLEAVSYGFRK